MRSIIVCLLIVAVLGQDLVRVPLHKRKHTPEQASRWVQEMRQRQSGELPMRNLGAKLSSGDLPLVVMENFGDEIWVGNLTIGTPPQGPYLCVFDSGSSNLWVPDVSCSDSGCKGKPRYNSTASQSAAAVGKTFVIPYGTGFSAGELFYDVVHVAGMNVKNDTFGSAVVMAKFFEDTPLAGILGLGFSDIAVPKGTPTVFDMMVSQHLIPKAQFSVFLSNDQSAYDSFVVFGGVDPRFMAPGATFTYANVYLPSYWLVGMSATYVGGKVNHNCDFKYCLTVIDTGTSIIAGPGPDIKPMIAAIGTVNPDCSNVNSLPIISFKINNVMYDVPPQIYVIKTATNNGTQCVLGMESIPEVEAGPLWILGDPFLRTYYTVFDKSTTPPRVGFAKAAPTNGW